MPIINLIEKEKRPSDPGYRLVDAVYLGTQEECIFARNPNVSVATSPIGVGGDCLVGKRLALEEDIKAKLMTMPGIRTIAIVESPARGGWRFELSDGWDGKSGALIALGKRVYRVFISSYATGDGGSQGHFLIQEVAKDVRLTGNVLHAPDLDNMLRLSLWEKPVTFHQVGRRELPVPERWGGAVIIEGAKPGGLIEEVLGVINEKTREKRVPVWRKNKI
jgi:hypothetical protein